MPRVAQAEPAALHRVVPRITRQITAETLRTVTLPAAALPRPRTWPAIPAAPQQVDRHPAVRPMAEMRPAAQPRVAQPLPAVPPVATPTVAAIAGATAETEPAVLGSVARAPVAPVERPIAVRPMVATVAREEPAAQPVSVPLARLLLEMAATQIQRQLEVGAVTLRRPRPVETAVPRPAAQPIPVTVVQAALAQQVVLPPQVLHRQPAEPELVATARAASGPAGMAATPSDRPLAD